MTLDYLLKYSPKETLFINIVTLILKSGVTLRVFLSDPDFDVRKFL